MVGLVRGVLNLELWSSGISVMPGCNPLSAVFYLISQSMFNRSSWFYFWYWPAPFYVMWFLMLIQGSKGISNLLLKEEICAGLSTVRYSLQFVLMFFFFSPNNLLARIWFNFTSTLALVYIRHPRFYAIYFILNHIKKKYIVKSFLNRF